MAEAEVTGRRSQRERREKTREQLLRAAYEGLVEIGYASLTTSEIVKRAGVSQGALFNHFASKGELLGEVARFVLARLVALHQKKLAAQKTAAEDPLLALDILWNDIYKTPEVAATLELSMAARTDTDLHRHLLPVQQKHRAVILELARATSPELARSHGERFERVSDLVFYALSGLVLNSRVDAKSVEAAYQQFRELMTIGLSVLESTKE